MKKIFASVLAIAITATSFANPSSASTITVDGTDTNKISEPKEGKKKLAASADFIKESNKLSRKMEMVADKSADLNSQLAYKQSMATLLNALELEKHNNHVENLNAEMNYNTVMTKLLLNMEQEKLKDTLEDLNAGVQYTVSMESILHKVTAK